MGPLVRYSLELWRRISEELAGGRSLRSVCSEDGMPEVRTVTGWVASDPELAADYFRARRAGALCWADDVVEMADASRGLDMAGVRSHRLSVDARR